MDQIVFEKKQVEAAPKLYSHVRCSVKYWNEIERLSEACNLNKRQVTDALLGFALKRVKLVERPLFRMNQRDIGESVEVDDED